VATTASGGAAQAGEGSASGAEPVKAATKTAAERRAEVAALRKGATRDPKELTRIKDSLNKLLQLSPNSPRYQIVKLGGVSGRDLLDVRVVGSRDDVVERAVEAPLARIIVNVAESNLLIEFKDGDLIRGRLRAPFFQGRYGLLLDADAAQWKSSGLTCFTLK
jgi:hypothetical protein